MDKRYIDKCYMADAVTGQQAGRPAPEAEEASSNEDGRLGPGYDGISGADAETPAQPVRASSNPR